MAMYFASLSNWHVASAQKICRKNIIHNVLVYMLQTEFIFFRLSIAANILNLQEKKESYPEILFTVSYL